MFLNHSSILIDYKSSNETMLQLFPLKDHYEDQVKEGIYDKRRVEVFNNTGTVYINAIGQGYL